MNKIYRKVWNKALGRIVVASELASSDGAGTTIGAVGTERVTQPARLALGVGLALAAMGAHAQSQDLDVGADGSVTAGQTVMDNDGLRVGAVAIGANAITVGSMTMDAGSNELRGLSNTTWDRNGSYTAGRAATEEQLKVVSDSANAGWNISVAGSQTNIGPGGTLTLQGDDNITLTQNNGTVSVALDKTLDLGAGGSVTMGGTSVNNTGLRITGGPSVTTTGINAGNRVVTGVANGAISSGSTEAVNGGQIYTLRDELYTVGAGVKYFHANSTAADSQALGGQSVAIGPNTVSNGFHSVAAGDGASTALTAQAAIAIGQLTSTPAAGSIAIGEQTRIESRFAEDAIALGTGTAVTGDTAARAVAIGAGGLASGAASVALGAATQALAANAVAIGNSAKATGAGSLAAGNGAEADSPNGIALGTGAGVGTNGTTAADRTSHIAIGTGAGTNVVGNQTTAMGYQAGTGVIGDQNIAIGSQAGTGITGDQNVALGYQANTAAGSRNRAVAIGANSQAGNEAAALGYNASAQTNGLALGSNSRADASGVALGRNTIAEGGHIALGAGSSALASDYAGTGYLTASPAIVGGSVISVGNTSSNLQRRIVNVADGASGYDAVNVRQLQAAQGKVASFIGGGVTVDGNGNYTPITLTTQGGQTLTFNTVTSALSALSNGQVDILPATAVTTDAAGRINNITAGVANTDVVNVGQLDQAIADNKSQYVSINSTDPANRNNAGATGVDATAIGPRSDAAGREALAVGYEASAQQEGAVALGRDVKAIGESSTAIGDGSDALGNSSVAIGDGARSSGTNSVVIGTDAQADPKAPGLTVDNAVVIGTGAEVSADSGTAIGRSTVASEERALAIGDDAHATNFDAMAQGTRARASGMRSHASGTDASATGIDAIASGTNSRGYATSAIALGTGAVSGVLSPIPGEEANNVNTTAIGNNARASQRNATSLGASANAQAQSALALGDSASARGVQASAVGTRAAATGTSSFAAGTDAEASGTSSFAAGTDAEASGTSAIATGTSAVASGASSIATGSSALASAQYATAIGATAQATAVNSFAAGFNAQASGTDAYALGRGSRASGTDSIAFGRDAIASNPDAVALGHNSVTAAAVATTGVTVDNRGYTFAGTSPGSTVSVGTDTIKRTITNVAAGRISSSSTDAINGSQLFATNTAVDALGSNLDSVGSTIASGLGGNSFYNSGTHQVVTRFQLGNTTYTTVDGALQRAASGINLTAQGANATNVGPTSTIGSTMDLRSANGNLAVSKRNDSNTVEFALAEDIDLGADGSLKTGNTRVDNAGVVITNGASGTLSTIINAGSSVVRDGTSDTTVTAGNVAVSTGGNTTNIGASSVAIGGANALLVDGSTGTVTGLSNKTFTPGSITSGQAASEDQLLQVSNVANAGWNATDANGNTANIGPDGKVTFTGDDNLTVAQTGADDAGVVNVALKKQLDLGPTGSVTTGTTVLASNGLSVGTGVGTTTVGATNISVGGANPVAINGAAGTVTGLTNKTFDAGNFTSGRAASEDQLAAVSQTVSAGWDISADGLNSTKVSSTSPSGSSVDLRSADGNVVLTKTAGSNDVAFGLADDIDLGSAGSLTTGNTVVDNAGVTVGSGVGATTVGATRINVGGANALVLNGATGTIGGLSNKTFDADNITSGQAASEDQLKQVSDLVSAGWNVTDANGNAANIGPNGKVTFTGDSNLTVAQTGADDAGVVSVSLKQNLDLGATGSITTGNTVVDNAGVAVTDGASSSLLGAGSLAISDGTYSSNVGATAITVGGANPLVLNGATGTLGGLTNTTFDATRITSGQAATEDQLLQVSNVANAGWNATDANGNAANIGPDGKVTFTGDSNLTVAQTGVDDAGNIAVSLKQNLDLGSTGSVAIGNSLLNSSGLTLVGGPSITAAGIDAGGSRITNVAAGVDGTDAVNVDQMDTAIEAGRTRYYSVNSTGGGNEANDGATGADAIAAGRDAEADGDQAVAMGVGALAGGTGSLAFGAGAQAEAVNSLAFGAGAMASHGNSIAMGAGSATTVGAQANYQGAYVGTSSSTGEMNVGGRQVTGVAAGSAATDAANVGQLQAGVASAVSDSNQYTDTQIGAVNTRIDGIDTRVTNVEGDIIDIRGDITDIRNDVVDIQGDITNLDGRMTTVEGDIRNANQVAINNAAKVNNMEYGADGMFQVSQDGTLDKPKVTGQNAVGGGKGTVASGANSTALGNQAVASGANSTAIGQGAVASHDNSVALGQGSKTTVGAQTGYNAAYVGSSTSTGEVNIGGRTMTGVSAGIAGTDATNVNQLTAGVNQAIASSNQYTDARIGKVEDDLWQLDRGYRSATASAMAMAGLPQAYLPGKSMLSMAFGGYQSEYGMALGLSGITDNGRWVYKAQASGNTMRDWGFSVGAGLQW